MRGDSRMGLLFDDKICVFGAKLIVEKRFVILIWLYRSRNKDYYSSYFEHKNELVNQLNRTKISSAFTFGNFLQLCTMNNQC